MPKTISGNALLYVSHRLGIQPRVLRGVNRVNCAAITSSAPAPLQQGADDDLPHQTAFLLNLRPTINPGQGVEKKEHEGTLL